MKITKLTLIILGLLLVGETAYLEVNCSQKPAETYSRADVISPYDSLFRAISLKYGYDWRFVSAVAYTESKFNPDCKSRAGAVGLMQITPVAARHFGVSADSLRNPAVNIELGVRLMDYYGDCLHFSRHTRHNDRISIILASYNCGIGHLYDVRRMAVNHGDDYNSWAVLQKYLRMKSEPEVYGDSTVVRCGRFDDVSQTITFVRRVMNRYEYYKNKTEI